MSRVEDNFSIISNNIANLCNVYVHPVVVECMISSVLQSDYDHNQCDDSVTHTTRMSSTRTKRNIIKINLCIEEEYCSIILSSYL